MHKLSTPTPTRVANLDIEPNIHFQPQNLSDKIADKFAKLLRFFADLFFAKRYGHRAIALKTVAAVPGMIGGLWQHMHSVRKIQDDKGWVRTLLDETKNERIHLMTFIEIAKPNFLECLIIMFVQAIFYNFYFFLYLSPPRATHGVFGYFEEEAEHRDVNHSFVEAIDLNNK